MNNTLTKTLTPDVKEMTLGELNFSAPELEADSMPASKAAMVSSASFSRLKSQRKRVLAILYDGLGRLIGMARHFYSGRFDEQRLTARDPYLEVFCNNHVHW